MLNLTLQRVIVLNEDFLLHLCKAIVYLKRDDPSCILKVTLGNSTQAEPILWKSVVSYDCAVPSLYISYLILLLTVDRLSLCVITKSS